MSSYLSLETDEEREYARQHARWLRDHASQLSDRNPQMAADYRKDAQDLGDAIRRKEGNLEVAMK